MAVEKGRGVSDFQLYHGDCLEILPTLEAGSVDLCLTDTPYGVGLDYNTYEDSIENWRKMFIEFVPEARRVSSMVVMPSCQINELEFIYKTYPPDWLICWHKGSPGTSAYIGFNDWEPLLVYGKTDKLCMHDYLSVTNKEKMGNYGHPCPKPIRWATWIIERASNPGDTILDPFMGSGTTGVACHLTGRNFIGIEIDETYFKIAEQRIKTAQQQIIMELTND